MIQTFNNKQNLRDRLANNFHTLHLETISKTPLSNKVEVFECNGF